MAAVTFNDVTKHFGGGAVAVDRFNLAVEDEEFMVLVGPSGCGKSTALRMLAGLEEITEGEIWIGDELVNDIDPRHRDLAMVFQSYALYPHMTVAENLGFGLRVRGTAKAEIARQVEDAARVLGLEGLLKRKPRQLSGGQRQRVALGRAIVRQPQVFLLDEPLSNLDAELRTQTRVELMRLHERLATTFLYVTHDQVEAMTMGTRIAVMRDGCLQQVASPREIYSSPANMYVAGFVGSPKISFVPVAIDGRTAKAAGFSVQLPRDPGVAAGLLGIRPDSFSERTGEAPVVLSMAVDVVEVLGADQFVYGTVAGDPVTARLDPRIRVAHGEAIRLALDVGRVHLFDPDSEQAIRLH